MELRQEPPSRDALCAPEVRDGEPAIVGSPWRGNLRDAFGAHEGRALIDELLRRTGLPMGTARKITIAIDTPLAWPRRMIELVAAGHLVDVPAEADRNPLVFRRQELALFGRGCRPLSTVRDMIGSQSTKGIYFLRRAGLRPGSTGVWADDGHSVVAIETYPAADVRDVEVGGRTDQLFVGVLGAERTRRSEPWQGDVRDAITCALVGWQYRTDVSRLDGPASTADAAEGWIWLPVGVTAAAKGGTSEPVS
jgi:hypothetical protein